MEQQRKELLDGERSMLNLQEQMANKVREPVSMVLTQSAVELRPEGEQRKVRLLQEELIEVRLCQEQELEQARLDLELEMAEQRRELIEQKDEIQKRFSPGTAPGEILDQNHGLRDKVSHLQQAELDLAHENEFLQKKCLDLQQQFDEASQEVQDYQQAIQDLEQSLV